MKAIIMAGGKGTRIRTINDEVPKPMIKIYGKPILEYQLISLSKQGIVDITIIVGYLGDKIVEYFGKGEKFGVNINYIKEETPLGTAGALYYLKDIINDDFIVVNGDIIFDIDVSRMYEYHKEKSAMVTLFTHPNDHPYDSSLIVTDTDGRIVEWISKENQRKIYKNRVNAGIHMFSQKIFQYLDVLGKKDMDRDLLQPLLEKEPIYAYDSPEYVKDMGTPERYHQVEDDIKKGLVNKRNLKTQQKAVFLDRDGVINKYVGYVTKPEQIELTEKICEKIIEYHKKGYLVIVITNQPVIARGDCTIEELESIHNYIETLLGKKGAYVDDIFYCPHHPHKGFDGEVIELKIDCDCRKPKPGLLLQAAKKYNINLEMSYMIGDSESDIQAGERAGCTAIWWDQIERYEIRPL